MTHYTQSDAIDHSGATSPEMSELAKVRAKFERAAHWMDMFTRTPEYARLRHVMLRHALDEYDQALAEMERALRKYEGGELHG